MSESVESTDQIMSSLTSSAASTTNEESQAIMKPATSTTSISTIKSTDSLPRSKIAKPSGLKPPSSASALLSSSTSIASASAASLSAASALAAPSRIGRICHGHAPKTGPPPLPDPKSDTNMRRQSDEYSRSHLSDVYEESETDFAIVDLPPTTTSPLPPLSPRSSKSRSPDSGAAAQKSDRKISNGSLNSELYLEATGNRRSSDHSIILTNDTDSFIIGQRVWVGGVRPGHIAFIGETHFAPGDWAGIVLDDPSGKNDGCVAGKRYFQCEAKRGIFSRLTRLTRDPMPGASQLSSSNDLNQSGFGSSSGILSLKSPSPRSGTVSPTASVKSYATIGGGKTPAKANMVIGDRVIVSSGLGSKVGILRYIGETKFASGNWCGVQLDDASGKNDGTVDGERYFECPPNYGIFVPLAKVTLSPSSRKTRLSRAGSKESLISVGTIASTATSRLRMSAQRLSNAAKPITTPKQTLTLQDILREKQNHIEQLILERDMEKHDNSNQILNYQKDIKQLKDTVLGLEQRLVSESRKAEDLQVSVDEATFCGDELNAQTQEYKERILQLEAQLVQLKSGIAEGKIDPVIATTTTAVVDDTAKYLEEISKLKAEINEKITELNNKTSELRKRDLEYQQSLDEITILKEKISETESEFTIKLGSLGVSEQCLREEIKFISTENEQLKEDLRNKDETNEKEFLNIKHIEHELKEELAAVKMELKLRDEALTSSGDELQKLNSEKDGIITDLNKSIVETQKLHETILADRVKEIDQLKSTVLETTQLNQSLTNDLSGLKTEIHGHLISIDEMNKTIGENSKLIVSLQTNLANTQNEYDKLNADQKLQYEQSEQQLISLKSQLSDWEIKFNELNAINCNLTDVVVKEKDEKINEFNLNFEKINSEMLELRNVKTNLENDLSQRDQTIDNNEVLITELQSQFKELSTKNSDLQKELTDFTNNIHGKDEVLSKLNEEINLSKETITKHAQEIESLRQEGLSKDNHIQHLQNTNQELINQITELNEKNTQQNVTIKEFTEKITNIESLKQIGDSKIDQLLIEISNLQTKLEQLTKDYDESKTSLNAANINLEQNSIDISEFKQQIEKLQRDGTNKLSEIEKTQKYTLEIEAKLDAAMAKATEIQENLSKLEVEHEDLKRQKTLQDQKCDQMLQEKQSLQQNLDTLQCSSSDTNTEIRRLTEELQIKQKSYEEMVDKSNSTQLSLERKLHEQTQNLAARTTQWERLREELDTLTTQRIDRENELNLELLRIKEASESDRESLANELNSLRLAHREERTELTEKWETKLKDADREKLEIEENLNKLEIINKTLQTQLENDRSENTTKHSELQAKIESLVAIELALRNEITTSKSQIESLIVTAASAGKSNEQEHQRLSLELIEKQKNSELLSVELIELTKKLSQSNEAHKISETRLEEIILERDTLNKSFQIESDRLNSQIKEMEEQLAEMTKNFKTTEDDQVDLVNKNLDLVETITLVRQQLSETEELYQEVADKYNQLDAEFLAYKTNEELVKKNFDENKENLVKILSEKDQIIESLKAEHQVLIASHTIETKKLIRLNQEEQERQKFEQNNKDHQQESKINEFIAQIQQKDSLINELQENIEHFKLSVNLSDDLKNELNNKSEQLRLKDETINNLNETLNNVRKEMQTKELEYQQSITDKQSISDSVNADLSKKSEEIHHLEDKLELLKRSLQQATETISLNSTEYSSLLGEKELITKENNKLNALIEEQQQEFHKKMEKFEEKSKFNAVKEELTIMEETKRQEVNELMAKLIIAEEQIKKNSENMNKFGKIQQREKDLQYEKTALERREKQLTEENQQLAEKLINMKASSMASNSTVKTSISTNKDDDDDTAAQISFLNSIIADMQKKNETLSHRIQALEASPAEFINNGLFDIPIRREPAPRLFCDICDEFDAHDTEDCPLQSSDSPPPEQAHSTGAVAKSDGSVKERKLPPPRKYCDSCEVFGHDTSECDNDETY